MQLVNGMMGLGDNIYQRAFVKAMDGEVYVITPWPELYSDLPNVKCVKSETTLRTQAKNERRNTQWHNAPHDAPRVKYHNLGIMQGMQRFFSSPPDELSIPDFGESPIPGKYVVVRPVTIRKEWPAIARNPLPEYISAAALSAKERGYTVVSVADISDEERLVGDPPPCDIAFHAGELDTRKLLALVQHASGIIGGIGWIVPAAIAAKVPAWIVCGGHGEYNSPDKLTTPDMDTSRIGWAIPDNFCMCANRDHDCKKEISGYEYKFSEWASRYLAMV